MPELPEVEIMTRNAQSWLAGQTITACDLIDPAALVDAPDWRAQELVGQQVLRASRRAKHLLIECERDTIAVHFRMTGKLVRLPDDGRIRFAITTERGSVGFKDTRRLGEVRILSPIDLHDWLEGLSLGPDAYPEKYDGTWWQQRFAKCRTAIKPALLKQNLVAGIGNILASEICFLVGVDPTTPANQVPTAVWDAIAETAPEFIGAVIDAEMADEIAYIGENRGVETTIFQVYGREGRPCTTCGNPILRLKQAQRSTFLCPVCQPAAS